MKSIQKTGRRAVAIQADSADPQAISRSVSEAVSTLGGLVVPAHSFKYVAALQASDLGAHPHLLRVEPRAGHGSGKPMDKAIEEFADMWAFAAHWTGLKAALRASCSGERFPPP